MPGLHQIIFADSVSCGVGFFCKNTAAVGEHSGGLAELSHLGKLSAGTYFKEKSVHIQGYPVEDIGAFGESCICCCFIRKIYVEKIETCGIIASEEF